MVVNSSIGVFFLKFFKFFLKIGGTKRGVFLRIMKGGFFYGKFGNFKTAITGLWLQKDS